jgi:hypothetical protein
VEACDLLGVNVYYCSQIVPNWVLICTLFEVGKITSPNFIWFQILICKLLVFDRFWSACLVVVLYIKKLFD